MSNNIYQKISLLVGSSLLQKVIGFVVLAVYARLLSSEELAIFPIFGLMAQAAIVFIGFGVEPFIIKELSVAVAAKESDKIIQIINSAKAYGVTAGFIAGLIFICMAWRLKETVANFENLNYFSIILISIGASIEMFNIIQINVLSALQKFKLVASIGLVKSIILPLFILPAYFYDPSLNSILLGLCVVSLIINLVCSISISKSVDMKASVGRLAFADIWRQSWPYYIDGIVIFLRRQGDQLLVVSLLGTSALGVYFLALRLVDLTTVFLRAGDKVIGTALAMHAIQGDAKIAESYQRLSAFCIYLGAPLTVMTALSAPLYINIVSGGRYPEAILPAAILAFRLVPDLIKNTIISGVMIAATSSVTRLKMTIVEVIIIFPALFIGAIYYGLNGIAAGPVLASFVAVIFGNYLLAEKFSNTFSYFEFLKVSLIAIITTTIGYLVIYSKLGILVGSIVAICSAMSIYAILFSSVVNKEKLMGVVSFLLPSRSLKIQRVFDLIDIRSIFSRK